MDTGMSDGLLVFGGMVFVAVFLLAQGLVIPAFGDSRKTRKLLKERLSQIDAASDDGAIASLLREKYLRQLTPMERQLESLPMMEALQQLIAQSGSTMPAYRLIALSIGLCLAGAIGAWILTKSLLAVLVGAAVGLAGPIVKVNRDRAKRIEKFEEQLPDAIDAMKRALRVGHPFAASLKLVAEDMDDPVAREFELTFADINYGSDVRRAMLGLLQRIPSVTVMALVTSVLVQKETGGNLAEVLEQISSVIRSRFRFQRRVRTLSAEGRMSAWILALIPFVLFLALTVSQPDYLPVLIKDPNGRMLVAGSFGLGIVGILWIRRIIRLDV